jgi:hypothetical protein
MKKKKIHSSNKMVTRKDLDDLDFEGINELSSDIFVEEFELNSTQNI